MEFRMMCLTNEFIHEALASGSSEGSTPPTVGNLGRCDDPTRAAGICSVHNGPECIALALRQWITALELPDSSIEHRSPWTTAILLYRDRLPPHASCRSPGGLDSQRT